MGWNSSLRYVKRQDQRISLIWWPKLKAREVHRYREIDSVTYIAYRYAMVYYQVNLSRTFKTKADKGKGHSRHLYVTRDCLGRRSLLVHRPSTTNRALFFASTLGRAMTDVQVEELDTTSVLCIDIGGWADQARVHGTQPHGHLLIYWDSHRKSASLNSILSLCSASRRES